MRILIADDDRDIRLLLSRILKKWGHEVFSASDGAEAWKILHEERISFVITDWMMPKLDGIELCSRIREAGFSRYIYIILLTAKDAKDELVQGMEAGADDFVVKPFNKDELKVRIRAGERIVNLERNLEDRNRNLSESNKKLGEAYSVIKKDLEAAGKIQASLLPKSASNILGVKFNWLFLPSTFVAGDIFNYFRLDEQFIGFYLLDVAGHGIPAALLSVTLSRVLSPMDLQDSPLKHYIAEPPHYEITPPAKVVRELNRRFQANEEIMQYFTMIYGLVHTGSGRTKLTQAGHPSPVYLERDGNATFLGKGGYPVGMLPDVDYEECQVDLKRGDRLILYSDGITECTNGELEQFSEERLLKLLQEGKELPLEALTGKVEKNLRMWKGSDEFEDDVTLLAMEIA